MPVQVTRNFVIRSGDQTIVLSPEEIQKSVETEVVITCASGKCAGRHGQESPVSVTFREEEVARDPLKLSDAFFGLLKVGINSQPPQEFVFCSKQCLKDWLTYEFTPVQPPRIARENAKREQAGKLVELNPHLVRKTDNLPSPEDLDAVAREQEIVAITQGDGYSGDPGDEHE